jgi:hypothetical protein
VTTPTQIIERALTFTFAQSISTATGTPDVMEVAIIPLTDGNTTQATYAGGLKTAEVELSQPQNTVIFELIPSNSPGLDQAINYRVMWRANVNSRTYTYDFQMPDADLTWGQLVAGAGTIIDGETYLQNTDLGIPNRVAQLDGSGIPITSNGTEVALSTDISTVLNDINVETIAREAADAALNSDLQAQISSQITSTIATAEAYTNNQITTINGDIANERGSRINADDDLQTQITTNLTNATSQFDSITADLGTNTDALAAKADLVDGVIPIDELPTSILPHAVSVPNQAAMLALTAPTVQQGNIAVRPDGIFFLNGADPSVLSNWVPLSIITSVNGYRGVVSLAATDVGAIPVGGSVNQSQVTGLATSLAAKANQTDMTSAEAAISAIQNDTTIVHTSSTATPANTIPSTLLDANMVYLNSSGQLTHKDGTIIPISGGGGNVFSVNGQTGLVVLSAANVGAIPVGGSVGQGQVTGLATTLTAKADLVSGTVPLSELPSLPQTQITGLSTALSNKADLVSGLIPLGEIPAIPQSGITGLSTLLTGNQLTSSTNAVNRISSLESQIATLGGGGGGGGTTTTTPFYTSSNTTSAVVATSGSFTSSVNLHSPWGIDSDGTVTGTVGTWYYLFTGVRSTDVAFPYISSNGHLQLHAWNESGPADPVYALESDLVTANTAIAARALETDLVTLQNTVNTKANQSDLTALGTEVGTLATTSALNSLATQVANCATSAQLATTNATVATLATQASVASLTTTVGTLATQSALATTNSNVSAIQTALPSKADLVSGVLKSSEIPPLAISNITGLQTALNGCATLTGSGSTVPLGQMPQNIPQSYVAGLGTTLGAKADLVNGVVPLSELPALNLPNVITVANQAAMLALTTAQVGSGTIVLVTAGAGVGTYIFTGNNPAQLTSWTELATPNAPVTSVNSYTGTVVLQASDVGALAANASIPITQITGLSTQLSTFALQTSLTSGLAGKTAPADVQNMLTNSSFTKRADYVANTALASLSGQQSVDGVLVPNGAIVLATSQSSSVNNGLWTVNAGGSWTRPPDFATGSYLARDTLVLVSNATGQSNGVANPYTIWQMQVASGFIDTNANNWTRIGWVDPPFVPTAGNGINVSGSTFSANVLTGGGVLSTSSGLQRDPNVVPGKFVGPVPGGSTVAGVTHNLNSTTPMVSIWQTGSNTLVLAGVTVTSPNAISIEFNSAPATGQYNVCILG